MSYEKMNEAVKTPWLEALRSGKYSQTKGMLKGDDGYCCLGVLCDLKDPEDWHDRREDGESYGDFPFGYSKEMASELPPEDVHTWAGIDGEVADILATKNDGGMPFSGIADWIEANL